jgi:ribosomal protein L16 Arg81 hydroxylase
MLGGCKNVFLATSLLPLASSMLVLPPSSVCRRHFHHNTDVKSYYKANSKERYIHRNDCAPKAAHDDKYVLEWKEDMIDVITNNKSNSDDDDGHVFNAALFSVSKAWGRRPFLLRNAFDPDKLMTLDEDIDIQEADDNDDEFSPMTPWPSWQDVVDIASDDDAESRVISHIPGDYSTFDIRWGALSDAEIDKWLSKEIATTEASNQQAENVRKETLVVNDVDRFHPPLADWIYDTFNFIPIWRMDDGQISLAEVDGGIGPHVDNYDVFLIQMNGSRTWQVGKRKIDAMEERDRLISGIDVRVLSDWDDGQDADNTEVEEWLLKPGDMLYLPPRVPHCGIALSAGCMTLSVGCRAPSVSDLVSRLAEQLSNSIEDVAVRRYTDDDLLDDGSRDNFSPGEITAKAKEDAKRLILNALTNMMDDDSVWDEFFGRYCTEPKRLRNNYPIPLEDDDEFDDGPTVQDVLDGRGVLYHAEGLCFSHSELKSQDLSVTSSIHRLFINGEMWQGDTADDGILYQTIANNRVLDGITLLNSIGDEERRANTVEFLDELVSSGLLYVSIE